MPDSISNDPSQITNDTILAQINADQINTDQINAASLKSQVNAEQVTADQVNAAAADPSTVVDQTSLAAGQYVLGLTMNKVYILLSKMIESMQNVAVVQSNRLNVLTDWENAYNAKMNTVHSFVQSNGDAFNLGANDSTTSTLRQDLNNVNSNYTEQMKSNSGIVSDDAKGMQTIIGNTQDNVKRASDMATSLVQQFQTIQSSIFQ